MATNFVHLHLHTDYSLLDGACNIARVVERAAELKMPAVAVTDHGNLFGAVKFHQAAQKYGVKPIIGCEVYVAPTNRFDKSSDAERYNHLVLLCEDERGYRNLVKLASSAYLEGYYYKPRIDKDLLARHSEGLVALSACLKGEVAAALMSDRYDAARQSAYDLRDIFGKGNFFLEIQNQGLTEDGKVNPQLARLSRDTGIPLVATNDCHYVTRVDARAQEVLMCIQTGKTLSDPNHMKFATDQFYFKSGDEMLAAFKEIPEALERTIEIAARCNVHLLENKQHVFPHFEVPAGETLDSFFEKVTREGFAGRREALERRQAEGRLRHPLDAYEERLEREIELIKQMRYAGYFLIVWDFTRFAREKCIPVGPGRGSAAGSLVSYSLRITDIDPLQYDLLFERFLNPERITFPDIDIDFCVRRRSEVIEYVTQKYGRGNVSQIITFGTMGAKAVVRDAARALDVPFSEADKIAKLIPNQLNITLEEALAQSPELKQLRSSDARVKEVLEIAASLEGLSRHASTHAAGVVISPQPLEEIVPLYKSNKDEITTQYAMDDLEKIGLLKMDFLGLTTLTILDDCVKEIERTCGEKLDLDGLALDDAATYEMLGKGLTAGIFQFESRGMTDIVRRVKPNRLADLTALNALYRPGPIQGGMIDDFIARKSGKKRVTYDLPQLQEILEETYGVIVYQEQVMQIAASVAGFSLGEADVLRRAMGKKKHEEMVAMREKFLAGARSNKVPDKKAEKLFELMEQFAGYGFNKSHSAAYALVAYQTAFLKAHYPVEFMAALLTAEIGNTDKLTFYLNECRDMGINILPPDVNSSDHHFTPCGTPPDQGIRFGLTAIKNVGGAAIQSVLEARRRLGRFDNLFQFCENTDLRLLNKRVIESLIKSGAMDSLGIHRARMVAALDRAIELGQARQREQQAGQHGLFGGGSEPEPLRPIEMPEAPEWTETERLAGEKEVLGFFVTGHPLEKYREQIAALTRQDTSSVEELDQDAPVTLAGIVTNLRVKPSKKGDLWAAAVLEDLRGSAELLVFPQTLQQIQGTLKQDAALLIKGRIRREENARPKVVVSEAKPLEAAVNGSKPLVCIRLNLAEAPDSIVNDLERVFAGFPGETPVVIELTQPGDFQARLRARRPKGVRVDAEMLSHLRALCGPESVSVERSGQA